MVVVNIKFLKFGVYLNLFLLNFFFVYLRFVIFILIGCIFLFKCGLKIVCFVNISIKIVMDKI